MKLELDKKEVELVREGLGLLKEQKNGESCRDSKCCPQTFNRHAGDELQIIDDLDSRIGKELEKLP